MCLFHLVMTLWETGSRPSPHTKSIFYLRHPSLQNYEQSISVVCKSPRLWYFIIAARIDEVIKLVFDAAVINACKCGCGLTTAQ